VLFFNKLGHKLPEMVKIEEILISCNTYSATITGIINYYPFGSLMPNRNITSEDYRFGFNGQEREDDLTVSGGNLIFKYRIHDARIGRFLSVDPLAPEYPWNSPYAFAENKVIQGIDLEGAEWESKYLWSDIISDESHIQLLNNECVYVENMTYIDAYKAMLPILAMDHYTSKEQFDCAEFSIHLVVEFAAKFELTIHFEDNYHAEKSATFNNNSSGIAQGNWEELSEKLNDDYSANDLYNIEKITKTKLSQDYDNVAIGDLIAIRWDGGQNQHNMPIVALTIENSPLIDSDFSINVIMGNTDANHEPKTLEYRDWYNRSFFDVGQSRIKMKSEFSGFQGDFKFQEWNFEEFDNNSGLPEPINNETDETK